ncbi:MAG: hypothetical protein M3Y70_00515 [Pseudomonadota bacterium]|nr:hypothetical protein [Pseudomonadota bacterium]
MNRSSRRGGLGAALAALSSSLQWRILLLWILATLVPTLLVATPLWSALQAQFAHTPHAADIASGQNLPLLLQGMSEVGEQGASLFTGLAGGSLLMLLFSPWLTGMVVASLRARRRLGLGELVHGGLSEYWRMLRMMLWSLLPLGLALMVGGGVIGALKEGTGQAVLATEVESATRTGMIVAVIVFVLAHATVEAGRGWLGADASLRSVVKAWWRGLKLLLRRPLATLLVYVVAGIVGYGLALLFAWLRLKVDGVGQGAFILSFLCGQAIVAALAWGRIARLYGMADLAADRLVRN